MNIKQFKLTNNEEIICEVIEWNTGEDPGDILIKKALRVISVEDYQKGWRFFAFRPWMSFQDDPDLLQTLNSSHIIVTINTAQLKKIVFFLIPAVIILLNSNQKILCTRVYPLFLRYTILFYHTFHHLYTVIFSTKRNKIYENEHENF